MRVHRKLNDFELKHTREFVKKIMWQNMFHSFNCKIALDILELIILICYSMLSVYQYIYIPKTMTDSSLLSFPI